MVWERQHAVVFLLPEIPPLPPPRGCRQGHRAAGRAICLQAALTKPGERQALHQDQTAVLSASHFMLTEGCLREKAEPVCPPPPPLSPLGPGRDFHLQDEIAALPRTAGVCGQLPAAGTDAPAPGACACGVRDCCDGRSWHKLLYGDPGGW